VTAALKVLARAALVSAALVAAVAHVQPAAAATPCWKTLLNDWYDGRIDRTYPRHCYTEALHHLPADVATYSSARDDITRALQTAVAAQAKKGRALGPGSPVPAQPPTKTTPSQTATSSTTTTTTVAPAPSPGNKDGTGLADKLNPGSATSVPVPLLVLGGLALVLVAAGAVGLAVKYIQGRRPSV
jgi:hypothetical protein